jgi:hypothetical protein
METDAFTTRVSGNASSVARFSDDGRYILYGIGTPSRSEPPDATEAVEEVVIHDLQEKREVRRLPQKPGHHLLQIGCALNDSRLLVVAGTNETRQNAGPGRLAEATRVSSARLYEFPSGRLIAELKLPADKPLDGIQFTTRGWRGTGAEVQAASPHWDSQTGEYLGELPRESRPSLPADVRQPARQEFGREERGERVVRFIQSLDPAGDPFRTYTVEVWDAARQGEGDRPLFVIEATAASQFSLSPDGKRLLMVLSTISGRWSRTTLYCTDTGRPVLTLPDLPTIPLTLGRLRNQDGSGFWSDDGRQFWMRMDRDGHLFGYDFRPREEAKK